MAKLSVHRGTNSQAVLEQAQASTNNGALLVDKTSKYLYINDGSEDPIRIEGTRASEQTFDAKIKTRANALRATKTGTIIQIEDADPSVNQALIIIDGADTATMVGKNLCDSVLENSSISWDTTGIYAKKTLNFLPIGNYTISFFDTDNQPLSIFWQSGGTGITYSAGAQTCTVFKAEITDPQNAWVQFRANDSRAPAKDLIKMQIEAGDTATEFTPYAEPIIVASGTEIELVPDVATIYNKDAIITCEYSRDINAAYEELRNAILLLQGGTS